MKKRHTSTASIVEAKSSGAASSVAVEAVRRRAYELYLERISNGRMGDALSDWTRAEKELGLSASAPVLRPRL